MKSYPWDSVVSGLDANGYPILDRAYSAADLRDVYSAFLTEGVFMDGTGGLAVTAGEGMSVVVAAGRCFVRGAIGVEPSARELALQAASSADRIDSVVLRWDASIETRSIDLYVKTGVAASVPTRPALTRSETVWELGLADVFVPASSTAVSAERITDTRLETERCGAVAPFAPVDTDTFFDQIQAAIDKQTAELQAQTDRAVELAEKAVDETLAGELMQEIEDLVARAAHPGVIYPFGGSVLPPNFLWCDGAEHSRTEYPELFAAIGTAYGAGDGSTTFNVPDLRGRVAMGASDAHPMGETGGEEKHAQTVDEIPAHAHGVRISWSDTSSEVNTLVAGGNVLTVSSAAGYIGVDRGMVTREVGGSQPFNVMQPYATTQYIIATGKGGGVSVADIVQGAQALPLGVEYGGTGANTAAGALVALGVNDAIGASINAIKIGGRNLLLSSDSEKTVTKESDSADTAGTYRMTDYGIGRVKIGDVVTISFESKATEEGHPFRAYVRNSSYANVFAGGLAAVYPTLEWGRYSVEVEISEDGAALVQMLASSSPGSSGVTFYVRNAKMEIGNKATEWTAAPEDTADYIVAQGTSGNWTWVKYASGVAECWGVHASSIDCSTQSGSFYYGLKTVDLPFTFVTGGFIAFPAWSCPIRFCTSGENTRLSNATSINIIGWSTVSNASAYLPAFVHMVGTWK